MRSFFARSFAGARWGAIMGALLSAWVAVLAVVQGSSRFQDARGRSLSLIAIVGFYLTAGTLVGLLFGACLPIIRGRIGAVTIGVIAGLISGVLVVGLNRGQLIAPVDDWPSVVVFALAMGSLGGLIVRGFVLQDEGQGRKG